MSTTTVGAAQERLAADFLSQLGFRVLHRNYRCEGGELDLVCEDGATLVFVEVRSRADDLLGDPLETVGAGKRRRIVCAARHYLTYETTQARECRFDVIGIVGDTVTHVRDAFRTDGAI